MVTFETCVECVRTGDLLDASRIPDNSVKLQLYGLYKQSTCGNATGTRPSVFHMKDRAKWDQWKTYCGMSSDTAKRMYVDLVSSWWKLGDTGHDAT